VKIRPLFAAFLLVAACARMPDEHGVNLQLTNTGAAPLACRIAYGHWVERDLGELAPGTTFDIALRQQDGDNALFIHRDDMQRRLMIENIHCGRADNWRDTAGQIDFAQPRQRKVAYLEAACAAPAGPGRVECRLVDIAP
jgi:hypothetical protein